MANVEGNPLRAALRECRGGLRYVAMFSFFINLLVLTSPIYMMQIYDRVLNSGHVETLIFLTLIAGVAVMIMGVLEAVRGRLLNRISRWFEQKLAPDMINSAMRSALYGLPASAQPLRDLGAYPGVHRRPGRQRHLQLALGADFHRRHLDAASGAWHPRHRVGGGPADDRRAQRVRVAQAAEGGERTVDRQCPEGQFRHPQCRRLSCHGHASRLHAPVDEEEQGDPRFATGSGGSQFVAAWRLEVLPVVRADSRPRRRRLLRPAAADVGWRDDRLLDPARAGPGAGRAIDRQLEELRVRPSIPTSG